jgi:hypothetical protein
MYDAIYNDLASSPVKRNACTHKRVRRQGSNILLSIGSQMAVWLSALRAGIALPAGGSLVLISVRS